MKESTRKAYDSVISRLSGENYVVTANDIEELNTIFNGISTDYDNAINDIEQKDKDINKLKQDNWDLYNKIPRGESSRTNGEEPDNYTVDDLFK